MWTARTFSVEIETAALSSPTLTFEFHLPEPVLAQHPSITLRTRANGQELPPATYNTLGLQTYTARLSSVPAGSVVVEFELDRCIGPTDADARELGGSRGQVERGRRRWREKEPRAALGGRQAGHGVPFQTVQLVMRHPGQGLAGWEADNHGPEA